MKLIVIALMLLGLASKAYCHDTKVIEGPVVLHSNIADQWGGHTFCYLLEGDITGGGEIVKRPLPGANLMKRGYQATAYMFAANVLQGSVVPKEGVYIAADCFNPCRAPKTSGLSSFLMWKISR